MQVLWREAFDGNRPLTMDKFLYSYKPSKIRQSLGFYLISARGSSCRLIRLFSRLIGGRRWSSSSSQGFGQGILLRQAGTHSLPTLVRWVIYVLRVRCFLLLVLLVPLYLPNSNFFSCKMTPFDQILPRLRPKSTLFCRQELSLFGDTSSSSGLDLSLQKKHQPMSIPPINVSQLFCCIMVGQLVQTLILLFPIQEWQP